MGGGSSGGGRLSLGKEGSGSYLPGVKELLPPVFKDVLLPLQEAHTCTTRPSLYTDAVCGLLRTTKQRLNQLTNHVTWKGSRAKTSHFNLSGIICVALRVRLVSPVERFW